MLGNVRFILLEVYPNAHYYEGIFMLVMQIHEYFMNLFVRVSVIHFELEFEILVQKRFVVNVSSFSK